jgi:hypothetical protein
VRDLDSLDGELRLLAVVRQAIREQGGQPTSTVADGLLDERLHLTSQEEL